MAYGLDKQYEKKCASRKILYKDWVASMEEAESSSTGERAEAVFLSDAENGALGGWCQRTSGGFSSAHPEVCVVYGDEDVETAPGQYENPRAEALLVPGHLPVEGLSGRGSSGAEILL